MDILRVGNFALRYKTFIGEHKYTTHDIEIVKYYKIDKSLYAEPETVDDEACYVLADFNRKDKDPGESDLVSCGLRLVEEIKTTEDIKAIRKLAQLGIDILTEDPQPVNLERNDEFKSWRYDPNDGLLHYNK